MTARSIDRRRALRAFGATGLGGLLSACGGSSPSEPSAANATASTATGFEGAASCTLSPESTEGPYYFDVDAIRRDVREDRAGVPLTLDLRVLEASTCAPVGDAVVDIWHCDAEGVYSGFESASTGGPATRDDNTYLRGAQVTDGDGAVQFLTIYPGWYRGRTTHIHFKVHLDRSTLLTSQLYFPEEVNDAVAGIEPYASDDGRDTDNARDAIFDPSMVLTVTEDGDGYRGAMTINVLPSPA